MDTKLLPGRRAEKPKGWEVSLEGEGEDEQF